MEGGTGMITPVPTRSAPGAGSAVWDRLTIKLQALAVASPWSEADDDAIGDDGETRLGRAIRE